MIRAFSQTAGPMTLTEVAAITGLTKPSARRFLLTLTELGYVGVEGRQFYLLPKTLELGYAYLSSASIWELARPHMEALAAALQESSSAAVLDGADIVYTARVTTRRVMTVALSVGARVPAYVASMGRVLLADLAPDALERYLGAVELRPFTSRTVTDPARLRQAIETAGRQGFALVDEEFEDGLRSIAAPLRGSDGTVLAAVNVAAPTARVTLDVLERRFVPELLRTAAVINAELRMLPPPAALPPEA